MITIASDAEWQKFCQVLGNPAWSRNESFATAAGRKAAEDELDAHIAAWTKNHEHTALMEQLQQAGVTAGAVLSGPQVMSDTQLAAREFLLAIDRGRGRHTPVSGLCPQIP